MKLFALFLILCGTAILPAEPPAKPNFLVILADDLGFSDAGCYGSEIETPTLDRLAANGLRFTQFYNTARCWPSRSALITGFYPQQVRADPPQGRLPDWARTLPQLLKPLGYRCYHSGKWHVPGAPQPVKDAGFDHSLQLEDHDRNFNPRRILMNDILQPPVAPGSGYYTTVAFADHAILCLKEHQEKHAAQPFFSYLAFTVPHFPLQALPQDIDKYRERYRKGWEGLRKERFRRQQELGIVPGILSPVEPDIVAPSGTAEQLAAIPGEIRQAFAWDSLTNDQRDLQATKFAIHAAMVDRMDQEIGRVVEQIKTMGALENTVILFLSDNGASAEMLIRGDGHDPAATPGSAGSFLCLGPGGSTVCNTPFRRHKIWVHEGGISTPLIVHWPRGIKDRGSLRHDPGHLIDLLPTLVELAGGSLSNSAGAPAWPGRSLAPAFTKDGRVTHDFLFFHHSGNRALRTGDWKIVSAGNNGPWELYDLKSDRTETKNLATSQPDKVRDMAARWQQLQNQFVQQAGPAPADPRPTPGKSSPASPKPDGN